MEATAQEARRGASGFSDLEARGFWCAANRGVEVVRVHARRSSGAL